jgi:hypothetical protein
LLYVAEGLELTQRTVLMAVKKKQRDKETYGVLMPIVLHQTWKKISTM